MKKHHRITNLLLVVFVLSGPWAHAEDKAMINYQPLANELCIDFLSRDKNRDEDLGEFLKSEGVTAEKLADAVRKTVTLGRKLVAEGTPADNKLFVRLLAANTGGQVAVARNAVTPAIQADAAKEEKPTADEVTKAKAALWQRGVALLQEMPAPARTRFLSFNGQDPAALPRATRFNGPKAGEDFRALVEKESIRQREAAGDKTSKIPDPEYVAAAIDAHDAMNRFAVRLGYDKLVTDSAKGGAVPTKEQEAALNDEGAATAVIATPPAFNDDARLRNAGLSFSGGFGVIFAHEQDVSIGAVTARWNWIQRSATAKWNTWVGSNNAEGYALVPFRGIVEYFRFENSSPLSPLIGRDDIYSLQPQQRPLRATRRMEWSFFGPFIGSAATGEKVEYRPGEFERPYLVGLSSGWGYLDEAGSLVMLDLGVTISPHRGFDKARFYAGLSFDALVLQKITGFIRQAPSTTQ